jgi:hypothetical protein
MLEFTGLEQAVFTSVCDGQQGIADQLRKLLATARLSERDNTGHGFYTSFEVDRAAPAIDWPLRMIDGPNVEVDVGGETLLMGFILWLEDGYPNCLEGFQYGTPAGDDIDLKSTDLRDIVLLRPMS